MIDFPGNIGGGGFGAGKLPQIPHVNNGSDGAGTVRSAAAAASRIVEALKEIPANLAPDSVDKLLDGLLVGLLPENVLSLLDKPLQAELGVSQQADYDGEIGEIGDGGVGLGSYLVARQAVAEIRQALQEAVGEMRADSAAAAVEQSAPLAPIESIEDAKELAGDMRAFLERAANSQSPDASDAAITASGAENLRSDIDWAG